MVTIEVFVVLYLIVAGFAALMTYFEQVRTRNHDLLFNLLGFTACLFWPITLVAVTIAAQAQLLVSRA